MKMQTINHKCGHTSETPGHLLGRGKARQQRIHDRESKICPDCSHSRLVERAATLRRLDGTPYTADEQAAYIAKHA